MLKNKTLINFFKIITFIILFTLTMESLNIKAFSPKDVKIKNFTSSVTQTAFDDTTKIDLVWQTDEKMNYLKISIYLDIDGGTWENPYDTNKSNENCEYKEIPIDDGYEYRLSFYVVSGKVGTITLHWKYSFITNETIYEHLIYISTGNPNIQETNYNISSAIFIGVVATIASVISTYLIISSSERSINNNEEEEEKK